MKAASIVGFKVQNVVGYFRKKTGITLGKISCLGSSFSCTDRCDPLLRGNCGDEKQSGYEQRGHFTHHEIPSGA